MLGHGYGHLSFVRNTDAPALLSYLVRTATYIYIYVIIDLVPSWKDTLYVYDNMSLIEVHCNKIIKLEYEQKQRYLNGHDSWASRNPILVPKECVKQSGKCNDMSVVRCDN